MADLQLEVESCDEVQNLNLTLLVVVPSYAFCASSLGGLLDLNEKVLVCACGWGPHS